MEDEYRSIYMYPEYIPSQQLMKGMYSHEWMFCLAPTVLGVILFQIIGLMIGAAISAAIYILLVRSDKRSNLFEIFLHTYQFKTQQQLILRKPRGDSNSDSEKEEPKEIEEPASPKEKKKNKKTKVTKKEKKKKIKKEKTMQEYIPFKSIEDNKIIMENGDIFVFLKIRANNLDLMSHKDLGNLIRAFSKALDQNQYNLSFFIQDSVFSITDNILAIEKARALQKVPFLRSILDGYTAYLNSKKTDAVKKAFYLRIHIKKKETEIVELDDLVGTTIKNFRNGLNLQSVSRKELMQLLAIYMNKLFDDIPESEYMPEIKESKSLLIKEEREFQVCNIPEIYNFKDLICPITTSFQASFGKVGTNITKTYAVAEFLRNTDDTNLLSKISNLQGVTTAIYIEDLALSRYKDNLKKELKSKRSSIQDEVDEMDADISKNSLTGSYKRAKGSNQKFYYLSVYFQLSAKTQKQFDILEQTFLAEVNNISTILDDLKSLQKDAFLSVSPLGKNILGKLVKQNVPSDSTANLYPFNEPTLLDPSGLPLGNIVGRKVPLLYDPFMFRGGNLNVLILGASGQGKTTLLMVLLQMIVSMNGYVRNIDFLGTQKDFTEEIGGINIDVSGAGEFAINPLEIRMTGDVHVGIVSDYISIARKWMATYKPKWSERMLDLFEIYLTKTYKLKNIDDFSDINKLKPTDFPILEDVYQLIEQDRISYNPKTCKGSETDLKDLILGLESAVHGADSKMFNRYTELRGESMNDLHMINYDMSRMLNSDLSRKLAQWVNILLYTSQTIYANKNRKKKIALSIDELHRCLKSEYAPLLDVVSDVERTARNFMSAFIKSTQTIDEVDNNNEELKAKVKPLFSQSSTKFLFHLGDINYQQPKELLSLTDLETERLKEARNGQCLLRVGGQLYDLDVMMPDWFEKVKRDVSEL